MSEHHDVRELLGRSVATLEPSPDLYERSVRRGRSLARRRRAGAVATGVAGAAVLVLAVPGAVSVLQGERSVGFGPGVHPVTSPAAANSWAEPFTAPIDGRTQHTATWTGDALVIWGGTTVNQTGPLDSGAVWDGAGWRPTAAGPLEPRVGHGAVWTGERVLIAGGVNENAPDGGRPLEAAAYDPAADTWVELPPGPVQTRANAATVWTGDTLLVWGGMSAGYSALADGASYDARSQTWQTLPAAPLPGVRDPAFAWTGTELVVWAGSEQRATADDPDVQPIQGAAYDPGSRTWRSLTQPPFGIAYNAEAAMLGSDRVVLLTSSGGAIYDLPTDTWEPLALPPPANRSEGGLVWTGTQLLTWGGQDAASPRITADGVAYDPATGTWTAIPAAPLAGRVGHTLTWTGEDLIVWGGMDDRMASYPDGAVYRPADGAADAEALEAAAPRQGAAIGFVRVEQGVLTAYPAGSEGHRLYGPGDGPEITAASLEPGSTTHAWRAIASTGAGARSFLLLEGGQDGVSSRELDLPVSSPHVDPRPVWGPGGDVVWIEMDDEDTGRLRIGRWDGGELEETFAGALAVPNARPDPSAAGEAPDWDGKSRFWLDGMWTQVDLPGAAAAIGLQVSQPISEDFSNGTFSLRLERRPDGSYGITRQMARMAG